MASRSPRGPTGRAARRPPSRRALADARITEILAGICEPDARGRRKPESLYGSLKMWEHLNRQGIPVARCTVERLMRARRWRGVTRARTVRTTTPDPAHSRAPDLVEAGLHGAAARAAARGRLHLRAPGRRRVRLHRLRHRRVRGPDRRVGMLPVQADRVRGESNPPGRCPARPARPPDQRDSHSPQRCRIASNIPACDSPRPCCWQG